MEKEDHKTEAEIAGTTNIYLGDCLEVMKSIPDGSIDMVLTDLPYGVLNKGNEAAKWDSPIPMDPLWEQFLRVSKNNAAIVLFSQGMFTAKLMMSQPKLWRYNLIWDKCRASGFLPTYNVQLEDLNGREASHPQGRGKHKETNRCYGNVQRLQSCGVEDKKFPGSILSFPRPHCTGNHPTEKSVDLCRWLIRTYTNPGETVLDATVGSGTTIVAAALEGRNAIGIEMEKKYFDIAVKRIEPFTNQEQTSIIEMEGQVNQDDNK